MRTGIPLGAKSAEVFLQLGCSAVVAHLSRPAKVIPGISALWRGVLPQYLLSYTSFFVMQFMDDG